MGDLVPIYLKVMFTYLILPVLIITLVAVPFMIAPKFRSKKTEKRKKNSGDTL